MFNHSRFLLVLAQFHMQGHIQQQLDQIWSMVGVKVVNKIPTTASAGASCFSAHCKLYSVSNKEGTLLLPHKTSVCFSLRWWLLHKSEYKRKWVIMEEAVHWENESFKSCKILASFYWSACSWRNKSCLPSIFFKKVLVLKRKVL